MYIKISAKRKHISLEGSMSGREPKTDYINLDLRNDPLQAYTDADLGKEIREWVTWYDKITITVQEEKK